jgi:hypothetical protein
LLNWSFIQRVDVTARRVFQKRWLNGKVREIAPAIKSARDLAPGWSGFAGRAAYSVCHHVAFAVSLPVFTVASVTKPTRHLSGRSGAMAPVV